MLEFQRSQLRLCAAIRDPRGETAADMDARGLRVYRELFFRNVESTLASAFPVLRRLSDDAAWQALVRDFFARHLSRQPQLLRLAEEFLDYLERERAPDHPEDPAFLRELCHYEWVELALALQPDPPARADVDPEGDPLTAPPVVSPLAWSLAYRWPVHRLAPDYRPRQPPPDPTYLLVYRDAADAVRFLQLDASSARLMQLIEQQPQTDGGRLLHRIAGELAAPEPAAVIEAGRRRLAEFRRRGILLGTRRRL